MMQALAGISAAAATTTASLLLVTFALLLQPTSSSFFQGQQQHTKKLNMPSCFCRPFSRSSSRPSLSSFSLWRRAAFLTPENQKQIDDARGSRQFRASGTALNAAADGAGDKLSFNSKEEYFAHLKSISDLPQVCYFLLVLL